MTLIKFEKQRVGPKQISKYERMLYLSINLRVFLKPPFRYDIYTDADNHLIGLNLMDKEIGGYLVKSNRIHTRLDTLPNGKYVLQEEKDGMLIFKLKD